MRLKAKVPKELRYEVNISWDGATGGMAKAVSSGKSVPFDTPREFGGLGRAPCPDELFLTSLGGCFLNTFLYISKGLKEYIKDIRVNIKCELVMRSGKYVIANVGLNVRVVAKKELTEHLERLARTAFDYCHLVSALSAEVGVSFDLELVPV